MASVNDKFPAHEQPISDTLKNQYVCDNFYYLNTQILLVEIIVWVPWFECWHCKRQAIDPLKIVDLLPLKELNHCFH